MTPHWLVAFCVMGRVMEWVEIVLLHNPEITCKWEKGYQTLNSSHTGLPISKPFI